METKKKKTATAGLPDWLHNQLHAGRSSHERGDAIWHTDTKGKYWIGNLYHRTPKQLHTECLSVIRDLERQHPELRKRKATP